MNSPITQLKIPDWATTNDYIEFFYVFSRFEYALKNTGYLVNITDNADACAYWDKFANSLPNEFIKKQIQLISEISSEQPKKQVVKIIDDTPCLIFINNQLDITINTNLFLTIRKIRNNLFHGGKEIYPIDVNSRDARLVKEATLIMKNALLHKNSEKLLNEFNSCA